MRRLLLILVLAVGLPAAALGQESPADEPADDAGEPADAIKKSTRGLSPHVY